MAVKTKSQLKADGAALVVPITKVALVAHLDNMIDSYEDFIVSYTTAQRDALTPSAGLKIYNTTNNRVEYYNGTAWIAASQKPVVAVNCSANPNYVEASVGDQYIVSVAGKIGGASGKDVYVGDLVYCITKAAAGDEAAVGTSWGVCHSASSTDNPIFYTEISLSSAQILALNATPITIVAAPGAGKIILPIAYVGSYTHVTTAYSNHIIGVKYASGTVVNWELTVALNTIVANYISLTTPSVTLLNGCFANEALQAFVNTSNPTTGDGTMTIGVYYKIHVL